MQKERAIKLKDGRLVIPHVWPNDHVFGGLRFGSWVGIKNLTGGDVHLKVTVDGRQAGETVDLVANQLWAVPWGKNFGPMTVVVTSAAKPDAVDDLYVFWELTTLPGQ